MTIALRLLAFSWLFMNPAISQDAVALRIDAEFVPPAGFSAVAPRTPALYEGVRYSQGHEARLIVFVVPAAPDAAPEDLRGAADLVAAQFITHWQADSPVLPHKVMLLGAEGVRLAIITAAGRHFGLLLYTDANVAAELPELIAAAHSVRRSAQPYPPVAGPSFQSAQDGFALDLPLAFEHQPADAPTVLHATPPVHYGQFALLTIDRMTAHLDEPLAAAAALMATELADIFPSVSVPAITRCGAFDGYAVELTSPEHRGVAILIDLARTRVRATWLVEAPLFDTLRAALMRSLASLAPIERRYPVALDDTYRDSEHGFSLRPPLGFIRSSTTRGLVTFEQGAVRPPLSRLEVLLAPMDDSSADEADVCVRAAESIAAASGQSDAAVTRRMVNGRPAATVSVPAAAAAGMTEQHVLYACHQQVLDLVLVTPDAEALLLRPQLDATMLTFRCEPRNLAPELGERIRDAALQLSLRPPAGWTHTISAATLVCTEPGPAADRAQVIAGSRDFPADATLPIEQRLAGRPTRMIKALVDELQQSGLRLIRIEQASAAGVVAEFRLAYSADGRALREVVLIRDEAQHFLYARGFAPAARFGELRTLLEASLRTLERPSPP